jgi:hypothetical protein
MNVICFKVFLLDDPEAQNQGTWEKRARVELGTVEQ